MKKSTTPFAVHLIALAMSFALASSPRLDAAGHTASDGQAVMPQAVGYKDLFGIAVGVSGSIGLAGVPYAKSMGKLSQGAAYVFRSLDTATGTINESVKLTTSSGGFNSGFGSTVSVSGSIGLVGEPSQDPPASVNQGSAYVFRSLDSATGTIDESVKLIGSDGARTWFGSTVSLSGSMGLVGAPYAKVGADIPQGAAYVFRALDTATGTISESVKLIESDGADTFFGSTVSLFGNMGLVGAPNAKVRADIPQGAAYVFRALDTAIGTISETMKLTASDGERHDSFGHAVSLSSSIGLVGSLHTGTSNIGSAYVFRGLDTATGVVNESAKLVASDGDHDDEFGSAVHLSGSIGLVGVRRDVIGANASQGSAYVFRDLDRAVGSITENVKLTASDGGDYSHFGASVALDGDRFMIGAPYHDDGDGKAYSGSVSSVTTLDTGSTRQFISGISFQSQDDWIIGETADANEVILGSGDTARIRAFGKGVYIGKGVTSDLNILTVGGRIRARSVTIGNPGGNSGNTVRITRAGSLRALQICLAPRNMLMLEGRYHAVAQILKKIGTARLKAWTGRRWETVSVDNYNHYLATSFRDGYTVLKARVTR